MMHEAALRLGCSFQVLDHVSQTVAREGVIDQHSARGGTAKTDDARLARQLVTFNPGNTDPGGQPASVTAEEIKERRTLQFHWTKLSYGPGRRWLRSGVKDTGYSISKRPPRKRWSRRAVQRRREMMKPTIRPFWRL
jgi:hypothetical protein